MQLNNIKISKGSRKNRRRVGRGVASGCGKTSGRGMDGQRKRTSPGLKLYFEGGQMPLIRRIPKRGFNNRRFRKDFQILNLKDLNKFKDEEKVTPKLLKEKGLIDKLSKPVKILAGGELNKKIEVSAHAFSKSAEAKIKSTGGKVIRLEV